MGEGLVDSQIALGLARRSSCWLAGMELRLSNFVTLLVLHECPRFVGIMYVALVPPSILYSLLCLDFGEAGDLGKTRRRDTRGLDQSHNS